MGTTEVTYKQWLDVYAWATNNSYVFDNAGQMGGDRVWSLANHTNTEPVVILSWYDALKYCNALSDMTGLTPCYYTNGVSASHVLRYGTPAVSNSFMLLTNTANTTNGWRLPTEAEWEQAYYYTATTAYFWGNGDSGNYAWTRGNSFIKTQPVGQKLSNNYALFDMSGNAWEWVNDWYSNGYSTSPVVNPRGPTTGTYRVVRGGSFKETASSCTGTKRYYFVPTDARYYLGFRVCKTQ
ncbi:MAG: formylglycine-generating enzyme family protein, partial [Gammaproteobacteria bacterium]|nr:formylglycine-generating enzyme family protein [Gammaproteobacteria bacterium]